MQYKLKTPKAIERTVVKAYKAIERGVVGTYKKIENAFVSTFLETTDHASETEDSSETQTKR